MSRLFPGLVALMLAAAAAPALAASPLGVVLLEPARGADGQGLTRRAPDGRDLPVVKLAGASPTAQAARAVLASGFAAELPNLEREARRLDPHNVVCPAIGATAIVFLSDEDGGFPRRGFFLAQGAGEPVFCDDRFVDVTAEVATVANGEFEEVLIHEYGHVFLRRLLGEVPATPTRNFHSARTVTDPVTAFDEGFGEHTQPLSLSATGTPGYRARAFGMRPPSAADAWYSREETWIREAWIPQNRFIYRKADPRETEPARAWAREQAALDFDPCRLKSGAQMMASEGVAGTFFYKLIAAGYDPAGGAPALAARYSKLAPALAKMGGWHADGAPLAALVEAWGATYPDEREAVTALFLDVTKQATVSAANAGAEQAVGCAASQGDMKAFQPGRKAASEARAAILAQVLAGQLKLDAALPPHLWLAAPAQVKIAPAPWAPAASQPLVVDLNAATAADLRLATQGRLPDAAIGRLLALREARPFETLDEAAARAQVTAPEAAALAEMAAAFRALPAEARQ